LLPSPFKNWLSRSAGELAKKFTAKAITKMDILIKRIWARLSGKPRIEEVRKSVEKGKKITPQQMNQIAAYLQVAMDEDSLFEHEIRTLAQEINAGRLIDNSSMTQNNYGQAKGWQTKVEGGTAYIGEIHIQDKNS
jgi:hypothetical protein